MQIGNDYYKADLRQSGAFGAAMTPRADQLLDRSVSVREPEIRAQFERLVHAVGNLEGVARTLKDRLHEGGVLRIPAPSAAVGCEAKEANALHTEFGQRMAALVSVVDGIAASLRHTENILEV